MENRLQILHSIPLNDRKFDEMRDLLFREYDNYYVGNLSEAKNIEKYDLVIIHYLRAVDEEYLVENKINVQVIWFCWGGDLMALGKFYNKVLLHKTRLLRIKLQSKQSIVKRIKAFAKSYYPNSLDYLTGLRSKIASFNYIDYMVPVVPGDFDLLKKNYGTKIKGFHLNLINPLVEQSKFVERNGKNILLGNSATLSNNHIEAIDWLKNLDLEGRKIIIPLNYGDKLLADYISDYAKTYLGENQIMILREFLPFDEYNNLINTCDIVVMNHIRQQAMGNIIQALINGSYLYMRPESTVYKYLKENGIELGDITTEKKINPINKEILIRNRTIARRIFGADLQREKLKELINQVIKISGE